MTFSGNDIWHETYCCCTSMLILYAKLGTYRISGYVGYPARFLLSGDHPESGKNIRQFLPDIRQVGGHRDGDGRATDVASLSSPTPSNAAASECYTANGERAGAETGRQGVTVVKHGQLAPGPTTNQRMLTARAGYWRRAGSWTT
jgi:hypothetical protein